MFRFFSFAALRFKRCVPIISSLSESVTRGNDRRESGPKKISCKDKKGRANGTANARMRTKSGESFLMIRGQLIIGGP